MNDPWDDETTTPTDGLPQDAAPPYFRIEGHVTGKAMVVLVQSRQNRTLQPHAIHALMQLIHDVLPQKSPLGQYLTCTCGCSPPTRVALYESTRNKTTDALVPLANQAYLQAPKVCEARGIRVALIG